MPDASQTALNRTAASATLHCLTGCAIGEIAGMMISTALKWTTVPSIAISVILAFIFGYSFSLWSLVKHLKLKEALKVALAADTASITVMEITDNAFILAVPNAINAGLNTGLFWLSLCLSLALAFIAAFPLNRFLIARGKGHALAHTHH
jgi:ABC-type transport system involved in multi-copper enzyme maturation permease subunit